MPRLRDVDRHHRSCDERVARVAERQHGVVARAQLARLGVTRGMLEHRRRSGRWEVAAPGVIRIAGVPPTWRQEVMAACLAWGPGAVVSHRAAAALWGLDGFEPGPVELTVPRGRKRARTTAIVHRRALHRADVTLLDAIPITTCARTLVDVALLVSCERAEEVLDDALRRRLVTASRLRARLEALHRYPGTGVVRALLDARDGSSGAPASVFERRLLRLMRRARLPSPVLQHRVHVRGRTVAVVDFAYPERQLAIETDGYAFHHGRRAFDRDRARRNALTLLGWRVVHVTWPDLVEQPAAVVDAIRRALAAPPPPA